MRRFYILFLNLISIPTRIFSKISILAILQESEVSNKAAICSGVKFYRSSLGKYSYIGNNSFVINCTIGKFTSVAPDCYIGGTDHPMTWVSTSPVFHKWKNILRTNFTNNDFKIFKDTWIGNDVWIGNHSMIKAGVTIADGAVVGMGSIVTKNIGPYEIWAGNPAKLIRKRFSDDSIEAFLEIKWWDWSDCKIQEHAEKFCAVNEFLKGIS